MELQIFLVVAVGIIIATRLPSKPQLDAWMADGELQPAPIPRQRNHHRRR